MTLAALENKRQETNATTIRGQRIEPPGRYRTAWMKIVTLTIIGESLCERVTVHVTEQDELNPRNDLLFVT